MKRRPSGGRHQEEEDTRKKTPGPEMEKKDYKHIFKKIIWFFHVHKVVYE